MVLNYDTLQNQFGTSQKTPKVTLMSVLVVCVFRLAPD